MTLTHSREEYATKLRKAKKEDSIRKKRIKAVDVDSVGKSNLEEVLMRVEPKLLDATITNVLTTK